MLSLVVLTIPYFVSSNHLFIHSFHKHLVNLCHVVGHDVKGVIIAEG